jgi:hypothetical protein
MKTLYKLTDQNNKTHNETLWGPGVKRKATGKGYELCSDGLIHAYEDPLLAVFISPLHVNCTYSKLWKAKTTCKKIVRDGTKVGVKSLTTLHEIPLPIVTTTQRVAFGILCAKKICSDPTWNEWANKWLSGEDRSAAARAAYRAAADAAYAARAASNAASAAKYAAASNAAWYAADAAEAAWYASATIDLKEIAREAMKY